MSGKVVKALGQRNVGNAGSLKVVMVDIDHAILGVDSHGFWEHVNELN